MSLFLTEAGNIRPELVVEEAQEVVRDILTIQEPKKKIKAAQLRKFYGEVKRLELKMQTAIKNGADAETVFACTKPHIVILQAKAAYAKHRGVVPPEFEKWIQKYIAPMSTYKEFTAFSMHFEAIVGFAYGQGLKD